MKCVFVSSDDDDSPPFDIERTSRVEKLDTYFCSAFPPFYSVYYRMNTCEKLIRCYEIVML